MVPQLERTSFLAKSAWSLARMPRIRRTATQVTGEYGSHWARGAAWLARAESLEAWLSIDGEDVCDAYYNVAGRLERTRFDSSAFYRRKLLQALLTFFPGAKSVTEYGCGLGRNLLFLRRAVPSLAAYAYELAPEGVAVAQAAAQKFGIEASYAALDYVNAPASSFVFPPTDVAFTMFSLEQIPQRCAVALKNILARARLGSIHLEPVVENYPLNVRGLLGRLYQWKHDYLQGFEQAASELPVRRVEKELLMTAHNPFMFPSLYVLEK